MAGKALLTLALLAMICGVAPCQERIWRSYFELESRAGSTRELGQGNLFLPVWQDDSQLLFVDMRGQWTDSQSAEGNLGLAFRRILPSERIVGLYGFYDLRHRRQSGNHQQASLGAELLDVNWGFRLNGYIPDRRPVEFPTLNIAFLQGNNIVVRRGEERAYYGIDFEAERLLWAANPACRRKHDCNQQCGCKSCSATFGRLQSLDAELWAAAGVFHFDNDAPGFENITGPRARIELRLYDLPLLGDDSRLVASGQYEYDDVRGSIGSATLTVRIPFGPRTRSGPWLSPLVRRMVTPIVRDVDIVTNVALGRAEPAASARTGAVISNVVTADGNTANPEATIEGAGNNSVAIADGSAGNINTPGSIDLNPGQVLMGGGSQLAVFGSNTGAQATFTAPGTRGTIDSGAVGAVNAADNVCIQDVDLETDGDFADAVFINGNTNVLIQNVGMRTSGIDSNGVFAQGSSEFDVNYSTIITDGLGADGIQSGFLVSDFSVYTVNDTNITTNGESAQGIFASGVSLFDAKKCAISTHGFNSSGIRSTDNSRYTVTNCAITTTGNLSHGILSVGNSAALLPNSQFIVTGGSITTTGTDAAGIFAIPDAGKTQIFRANVVDINAANDGILLSGIAGTINATINGSPITAGVGFGIHEIDVLVGGTATVCLNAFGNILDNSDGTVNLATFSMDSTINVTEFEPTAADDLRELDDANRIPFTNVFQFGPGPINFDAGECPAPFVE